MSARWYVQVQTDLNSDESMEFSVLEDHYGEDVWIELGKGVREKIHDLWLDLCDDPQGDLLPKERFEYFLAQFVKEAKMAYQCKEIEDEEKLATHTNELTNLLGTLQAELMKKHEGCGFYEYDNYTQL